MGQISVSAPLNSSILLFAPFNSIDGILPFFAAHVERKIEGI
jgi:hypothetical protein